MGLPMRGENTATLGIFCSIVFCYPFLINPWGEGYYYADVKAYILITFTVILVWTAYGRAGGIRKFIFLKIGTAELLLLLFLLLVVVSTMLSLQISLVGNLTEHYGIFVVCSYFYLFWVASRFTPFESQRLVLILMGISASLCALYGIVQHYGIRLFPQDYLMSYRYKNRSFSFFDNPDYFGAYLVLAITITFTLFLAAKKRVLEVLYLFMFALLGVALLGSETRSAWLGAVTGLAILSLFIIKKRSDLLKKILLVMAFICFIFVSMNVFTQYDYVARVKSIAEDANKIMTNVDSENAGASRWYIWKIIMPIIKEHFWAGSGPNTFHIVFHPGIDPDFMKYLSYGPIYDANNDYLHIALTLGVPALIIYLFFLGFVLFKGLRTAAAVSGDQQIFAYGYVAAISGYLVQAVFNISVVSVAPYFWILLGFACSQMSVYEVIPFRKGNQFAK